MCTVSIVPTSSGYRVLHSRDEQRTRAPEIPPAWRDLPGGLRACWPTDPDAGGTWVGARDDGLFLGILNLNLPKEDLDPDRPDPTISRGLVIPELMESATLRDAVDRLERMQLRGMKPFRLLLAASGENGPAIHAVARFDAMDLTMPVDPSPLDAPLCLASSGLGDHLVQRRLPLFDEMVRPDPTPENQRRFHWHQWPDKPEYSVMMSRAAARTSSVTTVEVQKGKEPVVLYDPIPINDPAADPIGAGMLQ
ncbi:MAG: NRDE family protein [Phycisphaerales bacterium]